MEDYGAELTPTENYLIDVFLVSKVREETDKQTQPKSVEEEINQRRREWERQRQLR